jgi:hypothetical protein
MRFGKLARKAGNGLPSVCYRAPPQRISPVIARIPTTGNPLGGPLECWEMRGIVETTVIASLRLPQDPERRRKNQRFQRKPFELRPKTPQISFTAATSLAVHTYPNLAFYT